MMRKLCITSYRAQLKRVKRSTFYLRGRWELLTRNRRKHDGMGGIIHSPCWRHHYLEMGRAALKESK
jgi:hypothetical protein